ADRLGQAEADGPADERAQEVGDFGRAEPGLDEDDQGAEADADAHVEPQVGMKRPRQGRGPRRGRDEAGASHELPGHGYNSGYEGHARMKKTRRARLRHDTTGRAWTSRPP